nr:hypothetical protein CFP56_28066 [Quercus suber]
MERRFLPPIRTLAWNCRGVGRAPTVRALKKLTRNLNPKIIFTAESKVKAAKFNHIKAKLDYDSMVCVDPVGRAGGIALLWRKDVDLEAVLSDDNIIATLVYPSPPNSPLMLFAI